jgi:hypothetical protein
VVLEVGVFGGGIVIMCLFFSATTSGASYAIQLRNTLFDYILQAHPCLPRKGRAPTLLVG